MGHKKFTLSLCAVCVLSALSANAADEAETSSSSEPDERVVVVGSRAAPRSVSDSPAPVDVIGGDELEKNATNDMSSLLSSVVPSFNVNLQPISDAGTLVRPANLRGLPPDNTLILVNGKRRHRSAVISFLGGGLSDGAQGPDLAVIPAIALKQVEILRDGASAQYGSDAIAGVINFVLRDNASGGIAEVRWGEFYEGDGDSKTFSGNVGMPLSEAGFFNVSYEVKDNKATSRSVQRDDAAGLNIPGVANPAQVWGSPEVTDDYTWFVNSGLDLGGEDQAYMFGNLSSRSVTGGFFFRNPTNRGGIYSGDGGSTLLVGDLTPPGADNDDGVGCPTVNVITDANGTYPDPAGMALLLADPNCFAFNERLPAGFTPQFGGTVKDSSITLGTKGEFESGLLKSWFYDFSGTLGRNEAQFRINNTVNGSMGPDSPTSFEPGTYIQTEQTINANLTKYVDDLTIATGLEFRDESFQIINGDPASFEIGPLASQGFGIGSNGFPGFKPADSGTWNRDNWAVYGELEYNPGWEFVANLAVRHEDFSDFGSTDDYKLAAMYRFTEEIGVRGSFSTGFRAPTIGQSNVRNVTTAFVPGVGLTDQATLPPTNPISVQKGGKALTPEESEAVTLGAVFDLGSWYITLDAYRIEVVDRIAQVSPQTLTAADIAALEAQGIMDASSFTSIIFFANDFDTTTTGLDLVVNYDTDMWGAKTRFGLAANYGETEMDNYSSAISNTRVRQIEENLPKTRATLTMFQDYGWVSGLLRVNYYGSYWEAHLDDESLGIDATAETTVDIELGFGLSDDFSVKVGAQNLFDEYPVKNPWGASVAGAEYPPTSPMGFNGGFYYVEGRYTW